MPMSKSWNILYHCIASKLTMTIMMVTSMDQSKVNRSFFILMIVKVKAAIEKIWMWRVKNASFIIISLFTHMERFFICQNNRYSLKLMTWYCTMYLISSYVIKTHNIQRNIQKHIFEDLPGESSDHDCIGICEIMVIMLLIPFLVKNTRGDIGKSVF